MENVFLQKGLWGDLRLLLIKGVQNLVEEVHISLEEALRMATSYPAEAVAIDEKYGFIKEGYCRFDIF